MTIANSVAALIIVIVNVIIVSVNANLNVLNGNLDDNNRCDAGLAAAVENRFNNSGCR